MTRDTVIFWPESLPAETLEVTPAETVRGIYTGEIGVREATGRNDGTRVEEYLASASRRKGDAWCAAFVTWTFKQAGVNAVVSGWSPDWFPKGNTVYARDGERKAVPGSADVFGIYFQDLKRIAHVGFIDEWTDGGSYCMTVEGNTNDTGSREGDGVYRKRRLKSQVYKVSRWVDN